MKFIILFFVTVISFGFGGCSHAPAAHVSYTPAPSPVTGVPAPQVVKVQPKTVVTSFPRPVTYGRDAIIVVNNFSLGTLVDFYVGQTAVLVGLPAGDRAKVYPRSSVDGENIAFGTVAYKLSPTGEKQVVSTHNRILRMGHRNQFLTATWEVNPKGNPRISQAYSRDGYYFGR